MEGSTVKKMMIAALIACILVSGLMAQGTTTAPAAPAVTAVPAAPAATFSSSSSRHYTVWSDAGTADAAKLASTLDGLFGVFNEYFRFDDTKLRAPLTVRMFSAKAGFDAYLQKVIGEAKDDFVYLHYPTVERSELVIFRKPAGDDFNASLAHQAFVQFLKAFIHEPPLWMREGFAVFFEKTRLDPVSGTVVYAENQAWLETVKLLKSQDRLFPLSELMLMTADQARDGLDVFYPQSWALVAFLTGSTDRRYNRLIWDSISLLQADATLEANQTTVHDFFLRWHGAEAAGADFMSYLDAQKTFAELVTSGVRSYGDKDLETAAKVFAQAMAKNQTSYIPPYYLGLIAYARGDYALAEEYYLDAMTLGSDAPITNYALGINAYASRRFQEASGWLKKAMEGDPDKYQAKAGEILSRIEADL